MTQLNPRAVIGDNQDVDQAQIVSDRLTALYYPSDQSLDKLLGEMPNMPEDVSSDADALMLGALIKNLRDLDNKFEAFREAEKQPFLRGGNAVDTHFFSRRDKIARRKKGDRSVKPGAIDILQGRIDIWQEQKKIAERARLDAERLEAARIAREEQARLRKALEEAEAAHAKLLADIAAEKEREAKLATEISNADIVRVRSDGTNGAGVMLTSRQEGYAILIDRALIDMDALRPYFTDFEVEKALRGWAKAHGFKVQMDGADVGLRQVGVTR